MGAVLRGRDVDLGRDLAVKVLLDKYVNRPEVAQRFLEEAQIGGQLQHPGVVPVYDIGRFGERPFFTMKLIKGQTLAHLLGEREQPTDDRPRLLGIALKVSDTLAYAHAKGVIHRDLKPANIMVGSFGEVQVMDWGLAKVLAEGGVADEERASRMHQEMGTQIRTARTGLGAGSDTEAGSLLGTPAYMPPEQANGDIANLDRRADVFGLGAILCEILTGKPPYVGRSSEEVRRKACNGDLADATARLDAAGTDGELIALTKQCLAPEASDRPKDAQAVADGLSAYLNGVQERLQAAERERAVAVMREAEQRKKRKVQLALAAAVALLLLGSGAFGWWQSEQAVERRLANERAAAAVARLEGARQAERAQRELEDARRSADDAARRGRNAEAVAALLGQAEDALRAGDAAKARVALEAAKKRSADSGAEGQAERLERREADLALVQDLDVVDQFRWTVVENRFPDATEVAARTREALRRFGADAEAVSVGEAAARVSGSAAGERIVAALDRLLGQEKTAGVRALLRRLDVDPYRDAVRDAALANDQAKVAQLAGQKDALAQPPGFAAFLGISSAISVERRQQLLQAAVSRRPGDPNLLMTLANTYLERKQEWADERVRWYQAAVAAAPYNLIAHNNLGFALARKGDVDGAIACHKKAIELDPKYAKAHYNLGVALERKGDVDGAIACYKRAIELDPKVARAHTNLGAALNGKGDVDGAIACYKRAIELDPKDALTHYNLGVALERKGDVDGATACYKRAIELDPTLAPAHHNLGVALERKGDVDGAIACYKKAIELDAKAHSNLANALMGKGDVVGAIACLKQAIELDPTLAPTHHNLGVALADRGNVDGAIACYKKAIELDPKLTPARIGLAQVERLAAVRDKLPGLLNGSYTPASNAERLDLAKWCQIKKLHHMATRMYSAAFAAEPKLADDLTAGHRYNAACYAALAAAGKGEDAAKLGDTERTRLRQQALDWLRADLVQRGKLWETGKSADRAAVQRALRHWQQDRDLAGLRDPAALAQLPAEERAACEQLWAGVAALLTPAEAAAKKERK
jgi:tetratricopeptide (TPR) repeat protein